MGKRIVLGMGLLLVIATTAQARLAPPVVRLGIAIDAPQPLARAIEQHIVPQTMGHDMRVYNHERYMAMADQLGVLWPYSPASARRVGRALHLTHVALFDIARGDGRHSPAATLHVRLLDVRTGRLPVNKRYALPDGQISEAVAHRVVAALRYMLLGERIPAQPVLTQDASPLAQIGRQKMAAAPAAEDEGEPNLAPMQPPAGGQAMASTEDKATQVDRALRLEGRRQAHVGLAYALRKAQLSPAGAPCYCSNGRFAPGIVGASLSTALFFDPNKTHLGLELEASIGLATLPVTSGVYAQQSQTLPWSVAGALAYRLLENAPVVVTPHLGLAYSRFPISNGPFLGTAYTAVYAGAELESPPWGGHLILRAGGDFHIIAHSGLEAARLGTFQSGVGWQVQLSPTVRVGAFRLGLQARYGSVDTHYIGPTALYETTRYVDVSLSDTTLDVQVQFGGTLW